MKWTTLRSLLNGMVGNSLFLLSALSIASAIPLSGLFLKNKVLSLSIIGAVLIIISFILMKVNFPPEIEEHNNAYSFYDYILNIKSKNSLCYSMEFKCLEEDLNITNNLPIFHDKFIKIDTFKSIEKYNEKLGDERALLSMTFLKFNLMDTAKYRIRLFITYLFIVGTFLFYLGPFLRISNIILRSFL